MKLMQVTIMALDKCLGVKKKEKVAVITDGIESAVAQSFYHSACELAGEAVYLQFPPGKEHGQEPPELVAEVMRSADVALLVTSKSLSHTKARRQATDNGVRVASMPMITKEMASRALDVDFNVLSEETKRFADLLTQGERVEITTPAGTSLTMSLEGRTAHIDDASILERGQSSNLPGGEAYIAPVETDTNGEIVFEGSIAGWGKLKNPITVVVRKGQVIDVVGGKEANWLRELLAEHGEKAGVVAELGIGTNPKALLTGNILEDEKAKGTIHIALGNNKNFGGLNEASVHLDGMVLKPTVKIDEKEIILNGNWQTV